MASEAKTGNRKLIEQFLADGFTHMFGNPGTVEEGFLDAVADYPDLRYIVFASMAKALGLSGGLRVDSVEDAEKAADRMLDSNGAFLVDLRIG